MKRCGTVSARCCLLLLFLVFVVWDSFVRVLPVFWEAGWSVFFYVKEMFVAFSCA